MAKVQTNKTLKNGRIETTWNVVNELGNSINKFFSKEDAQDYADFVNCEGKYSDIYN